MTFLLFIILFTLAINLVFCYRAKSISGGGENIDDDIIGDNLTISSDRQF